MTPPARHVIARDTQSFQEIEWVIMPDSVPQGIDAIKKFSLWEPSQGRPPYLFPVKFEHILRDSAQTLKSPMEHQ